MLFITNINQKKFDKNWVISNRNCIFAMLKLRKKSWIKLKRLMRKFVIL